MARLGVPSDPQVIFADLTTDNEGVWVSQTLHSVSYPAEGNEDNFALEDTSFWYAHRAECILALTKNFGAPAPMVDVGGGNGFMSAAFEAEAIPTILVEAYRTGILNAKRRGLRTVVQGDFTQLQVAAGSIPTLGLFDVLEHVRDEHSFLEKIRRGLRDDGALYLSVPTGPWLWSQEDARAGHFRRYSLRHLVRRLEDCGFRVEFASHAFSIFVFPVFLTRTLPSLLGLRDASAVDFYKKEVGVSREALHPVLKFFLRAETFAFRHRLRIPFGTSGIIFARPKAL